MSSVVNEKNLEFRLRLQEEFARRCRSNNRYSLRAFARQSDIDASTLSQILSGKRQVSGKMREKICGRLGLPLKEEKSPEAIDNQYHLLHLDAFAAISDWQHFAILDLTLTKNFKSDFDWIARRLGISRLDAKLAVERLVRLGMLAKKGGSLVKAKSHYANYTEGVTSSAHKEYQRQVITKALHAIDNCAQERKDITSITIAASSEKLAAAKEKIKNFRRELCEFLEDGRRDSVYHLAVQLYPVTGAEE